MEGSEDFKKTREKTVHLDLSDGIVGEDLGILHELGLTLLIEVVSLQTSAYLREG